MGVKNLFALTIFTTFVPSLATPAPTSSLKTILATSPLSMIHSLNTSTILTYTFPRPPLNISAPSQVACFKPSYFRHQLDIDYSNCQQIIMWQITPPSAPTKDLRWGFPIQSSSIDVRLPGEGDWTHGTCNIFVSNMDRSQVDSFSVDAVAFAAKRVGEQCVKGRAKGLRTGGHVGIRHGKGFYVVLGEVSYDEGGGGVAT
ncbi:hypothetical protein N7G274_004970 [Stereocaulon virgatum]|uniref:Ecp2 effector protein domain-containing protein n=1 Tax=Stereocaulon virgatum TaxID=373712 RepID=A0ABR4A9B1_9LECA